MNGMKKNKPDFLPLSFDFVCLPSLLSYVVGMQRKWTNWVVISSYQKFIDAVGEILNSILALALLSLAEILDGIQVFTS